MGVLLLVRHGRGSLGTSNYDELSERGRRQARLVGARLARAELRVSQTWCGALARQRETARAVLTELGLPPGDLHADDRLDEYDYLGILAADGTGDPFASAATPDSRLALQSVLDEAIDRWIQGGADYPEPHSAFTAWVQAAVAELTPLARHDDGRDVGRSDRGGLRPACRATGGQP